MFLDNRQLHGHAFQILDEAMHFILRNIPIAGRIESGKLERQDTPLRTTHNLTDRQRRILLIVADGAKWSFGNIYKQLPDSPPKRTVQAELRLLA